MAKKVAVVHASPRYFAVKWCSGYWPDLMDSHGLQTVLEQKWPNATFKVTEVPPPDRLIAAAKDFRNRAFHILHRLTADHWPESEPHEEAEIAESSEELRDAVLEMEKSK